MDRLNLGDVSIEFADDEGVDQPVTDDAGNVLEIEHPDGAVSVSVDGAPLQDADDTESDKKWFRNLCSDISDSELGRIADDLLQGINDDILSRQEWIDARAEGIRLLGLNFEKPGTGDSLSGAPIEGMSTVRHSLLLEAVLRFQANARAELLPTDGPIKIRNDATKTLGNADEMADALEKDLNHYFTVTASEYYPDTDRMLLMLGFGGSAFKKTYFCPLRNRPVSESVDAEDLIFSNNATDLKNARRITHRIDMGPSTLKRMQILGIYRDVELSMPGPIDRNEAQREKDRQQGIDRESGSRPEDADREIYECYCELDINGLEHKKAGKTTGLPVPYRVTIDKDSQAILEIVRNYEEDDQELPTAKEVFVHYLFVPGLGLLGIGLLHILGNTTNALTAAWREFLDAGMFANFPGFLYSKQAGRQLTNLFRIPPGGGAPIDTGGMPINDAVMPLPYKEPGPASVQFVEQIAKDGQRLGGVAEIAVGEGKQDAPVGTTIALIEQAAKILNEVHKRCHTSQAQEFRLMRDLFRKNPASIYSKNAKPSFAWSEPIMLKALDDYELTPQADPNTASNMQRMAKAQTVWQMATTAPDMFDKQATLKYVLRAMQIPSDLMSQLPPGPPPDPKAQAAMVSAQADMINAQTKAKDVLFDQQNAKVEDENRDKDRQSAEDIAKMNLVKETVIHDREASMRGLMQDKDIAADAFGQHRDLSAAAQAQARDHAHQIAQQALIAQQEPPNASES